MRTCPGAPADTSTQQAFQRRVPLSAPEKFHQETQDVLQWEGLGEEGEGPRGAATTAPAPTPVVVAGVAPLVFLADSGGRDAVRGHRRSAALSLSLSVSASRL